MITGTGQSSCADDLIPFMMADANDNYFRASNRCECFLKKNLCVALTAVFVF